MTIPCYTVSVISKNAQAECRDLDFCRVPQRLALCLNDSAKVWRFSGDSNSVREVFTTVYFR